MRFQVVVISALFTATALASPLPQPHLNLEGLKDIFLHDKREASPEPAPAPVAAPNPVAAPAPEPSINMDSFLQEKSANPDSQPGYENMGNGADLCMGNDNSCVTGSGQITK